MDGVWINGVKMLALNLKCLPQAHVLTAWPLVGGAVLEVFGNFRRWNLAI